MDEVDQPSFAMGPRQRRATSRHDERAASEVQADGDADSLSTRPHPRRPGSDERSAQATADRRQQARTEFRGLILALLPESEIPCVGGNVSASGMLIYPCEQAEPVPQFRVSFRLPNHSKWLQLTGALVRIDVVGDRPAWGLRFIDVPRPVLANLRRFVALRSDTAALAVDDASAGSASNQTTAPLRPATTDEMDTRPRSTTPTSSTGRSLPRQLLSDPPALTLSPLPGLEQQSRRAPAPATVSEDEATDRFDVSGLGRPTVDRRGRHAAKPSEGAD